MNPIAIHLTAIGLFIVAWMSPGIVSEEFWGVSATVTIPKLVIVLDVDTNPLTFHCIDTAVLSIEQL